MIKRFCFILLFLLISLPVYSLDRCLEFVQPVRAEHTKYFGINFPYWYGVGQLKQESCCKADATAFDAGQGIAQFMPKTTQYVNSLMGTNLNPYNPKEAIRLQAFYMFHIHKQNWAKELWITYQGYNGGFALLKKEMERAGETDWGKMKKACKRKVLHLKWGDLDFCEVNYDYSKKIYDYGQLYKIGIDEWNFWKKQEVPNVDISIKSVEEPQKSSDCGLFCRYCNIIRNIFSL